MKSYPVQLNEQEVITVLGVLHGLLHHHQAYLLVFLLIPHL